MHYEYEEVLLELFLRVSHLRIFHLWNYAAMCTYVCAFTYCTCEK